MIGTCHVSVISVQNHWNLARRRGPFGGGIFFYKRMGNIDHVGHFPNRLSHRYVVHMDSCEGIGRHRWAEKIIGLEIPDRFPQGSQEVTSDKQACFTRNRTVRQVQGLKFILSDARRCTLLRHSHLSGFSRVMHMVTRSTVGANKNPGIQIITEFLPPKFKQTGCRKLIIVEVSMNKENPHGC